MEALNTQLLRFFDWLLWASLQGTVLIVMIVLLQIILRRRLPVRWHYLLWLLLLMRLAMPWLPQGMLETYSLEELRYVFIHELAHLKQRDIYLGWLMALLQVVHWFNPLMWFAFGRMRADREIACDRLAISTMEPDEPPKYGRTIVSLLESFSQVRYLPSVTGILEDTCQIKRRI